MAFWRASGGLLASLEDIQSPRFGVSRAAIRKLCLESWTSLKDTGHEAKTISGKVKGIVVP
jgi:hypothetical protein